MKRIYLDGICIKDVMRDRMLEEVGAELGIDGFCTGSSMVAPIRSSIDTESQTTQSILFPLIIPPESPGSHNAVYNVARHLKYGNCEIFEA